MQRSFVFLFVCSLFLFPTLSIAEPVQTIRIGSTPSAMMSLVERIRTPYERRYHTKLKSQLCEAVECFNRLSDDTSDLVFVNSIFGDVHDKWLKTHDVSEIDFGYTNIGLDSVVLYTHYFNPKKDYTIEELKDIFSGKTVEVSDSAGRRVPVTLYLAKEDSAIVDAFRRRVLNDATFSFSDRTTVWVDTLKEARYRALSDIGGMSIGPTIALESLKAHRIRVPHTNRPTLAVYDKNSKHKAEIEKLIEFIRSPEGKVHQGTTFSGSALHLKKYLDN